MEEKRFKIIEIELASKTVNKADPTTVTKFVGKTIIGEDNTLNGAKDKLIETLKEQHTTHEMNSAMCGGDSEIMALCDDNNEFLIWDSFYNIYYQLGYSDSMPECFDCFGDMYYWEPEEKLFDLNIKSLEELYGNGNWVM